MLTHAWLRHVCRGVFQVVSATKIVLCVFFFDILYLSVQEWREEAGDVEEVREGNLSHSGGYLHLRSVYFFFSTLVIDLFQVIANCLFVQ